MVAFLHTSPVHIVRFQALAEQYYINEIKHFVNTDLLTSALETGQPDIVAFTQEIEQIKTYSPKLIICTCSTYGDICQQFNGVKRIDTPIASYLTEKYQKILLAYTAHSTFKSSLHLIQQIAQKNNKSVQVIPCDCTVAWPAFEAQNISLYEKSIIDSIYDTYQDCDAIFLAQASMEGVISHLSHFPIEVVSSSHYGVKTYLELIH